MSRTFEMQVGIALIAASLLLGGLQVWSHKRVQDWAASQRPAWMDAAYREVLP
jgi:hypothetical protein